MKTWPCLKNPPVVVALFQLKFTSTKIQLSDFLKYDTQLKHRFPIRKDNIHVGIDLEKTSIPLGVSKISGTSDAQIKSYIYLSVDQKVKLEISNNTITYIDESPYIGWDHFKISALDSISILQELLNKVEISRTSIRFINRFSFESFDNPQEFFNTLISSSNENQLAFPLRQYGFRLIMDIPGTDIFSIVNQNVENIRTNSFIYLFDIDVLDRQQLFFDINTISKSLENLRDVKNEIFFTNLTQKTLDLCS